MNYRKFDKKARELHTKYKALQCILKDGNVDHNVSYKLNEYEKELYNKYLFYNGMKKAISVSNKEGEVMACGKGKKKK